MKKVYALLLILTLCVGLAGCGTQDDGSGLFTAKELQNTEMYRYDYWNSDFAEIPAEYKEPLLGVLSQAEVVETIPEGESLETDEYCLLFKGKNAEYLFCFEDAEEYISVENPHRYMPLLKVQKTVLKNGSPSETQVWICSLDAASYSKALNLTYCYNEYVQEEGWGEYELDGEILRESEIELLPDAYAGWLFGDDPANRKAVDDEAVRSEIIRIAESAQSYMPSVVLPLSMMLGGNGEPAVEFTYDTGDGKITHIISFQDSEVQMDEAYLYFDEPVVTISRTVYVKEHGLYMPVEESSFQCVISQEDYRWLWELTQG